MKTATGVQSLPTWQLNKNNILKELKLFLEKTQLYILSEKKLTSAQVLVKSGNLTLNNLELITNQPEEPRLFDGNNVITGLQNRIKKIDTLTNESKFNETYPDPKNEIDFLKELTAVQLEKISTKQSELNKIFERATKREAIKAKIEADKAKQTERDAEEKARQTQETNDIVKTILQEIIKNSSNIATKNAKKLRKQELEKVKIEGEKKLQEEDTVIEKIIIKMEEGVIAEILERAITGIEEKFPLETPIENETQDRIVHELQDKITGLEKNFQQKLEEEVERRVAIEVNERTKEFEDRLKHQAEQLNREFEDRLKHQAEQLNRDFEKRLETEVERRISMETKARINQLENQKQKKESQGTTTKIAFAPTQENPQAEPPLTSPPAFLLSNRDLEDLILRSKFDLIIEQNNIEGIINFATDYQQTMHAIVSSNRGFNSTIYKVLQSSNSEFLSKFIELSQPSIVENISQNQDIIKYMMNNLSDDAQRAQKIALITPLIPPKLINQKLETGYSPLFQALNYNDLPLLNSLTKNHAKLDSHETNIMICKITSEQHLSTDIKIQKLNFIQSASSPESWQDAINNKQHNSPLRLAFGVGDFYLVNALIEKGAEIDESNIHSAIYNLMINKKIDPDNKSKLLNKILNSASNKISPESWEEAINRRSTENYTLLDLAFDERNEYFALTLLNCGAKFVSCQNINNNIYYALNSDNFEKYAEIAKKNGENIFGFTNQNKHNLIHFLSFSQLNSKQKIQKLNLIENVMGREDFLQAINKIDKTGYKSLDFSIQKGDIDFALELAKKGVDLDINNSTSVLHKFYYHKNLDMMTAFYEEGLIKFTEFPKNILDNLKKIITDDINPNNNVFNQSFLSFIKEKEALEKTEKEPMSPRTTLKNRAPSLKISDGKSQHK